VPKELPVIPDSGSPNVYRTALIAAQKAKMLTDRELQLSNLDDKGDFSFLRDATYGDLMSLSVPSDGSPFNRDWYVGVVPKGMENELSAIYAAIDKHKMVGPVFSSASESDRPTTNVAATTAATARVQEILGQKIDQKKTTLTKEILVVTKLLATNRQQKISLAITMT
jgi:hypothetical protein